MGKDAAYLLANKRTVAETRRAVAKKTVAGSGKKRIVQKKDDDDESWDEADGETGKDTDEDRESARKGAYNINHIQHDAPMVFKC
eukprot:jgi/Phyca11/557817/estExt2_Genewise1Plus.C_PHYCAscaffold_6530001